MLKELETSNKKDHKEIKRRIEFVTKYVKPQSRDEHEIIHRMVTLEHADELAMVCMAKNLVDGF